MARWAYCKQEGLDVFKTRILSAPWVVNIGHFVYVDAYIKLARLGLIDVKNICLIIDKKNRVSNSCLLELYKEHITVRIVDETQYSDSLRSLHFWLREELDYIRIDDNRGMSLPSATVLANKKWAEAGLAPLLRTNTEIDSAGENFLRNHGIAADDWFVCVHARGPGYNGSTLRDCEFSTYRQIIERMISWGAKVIRMGNSSMPPAPQIDGLIDYAIMPDKDPKIDVYLISHCRFFVGCASGPEELTSLFNVPCILVNWAPIGSRPFNPNAYFLPKIYRCMDSQRILSIREVTAHGLAKVEFPESVISKNIMIEDNTPEQITEAVSYFFDHVILGKSLPLEDIKIQKDYEAAMDQAGIIGAGLVLPNFARQYPEVWSQSPKDGTKTIPLKALSVTRPADDLNTPDQTTPDLPKNALSTNIKKITGNPSVLLQRALAHHRDGRLTEATLLYEHILRTDVNQPDALHLLGKIHLHQGTIIQAEALFAQAITARPHVAVYRLSHGLALLKMGRNTEALADFTRAQSLDPSLVEAYYQAGHILKNLGHHREAILTLRKAVRLAHPPSKISSKPNDAILEPATSLS